MDQRVSSMVAPFCLILIVSYFLSASGNTEVKALYAFKLNLVDPNGVLRTWDPTLINPCSWDHIYCSTDNSAIAVRLGNANLTGILAPQLGDLRNLQSLELYSNNFSGTIPYELGNLTKLVTLDLPLNNLTGPIPDTLGNLKHLRFLRLNNNSLTGEIPKTLTTVPTLQVLDLAYNNLSGVIPFSSSSLFTPISFAGNPGLTMPEAGPPPGLPCKLACLNLDYYWKIVQLQHCWRSCFTLCSCGICPCLVVMKSRSLRIKSSLTLLICLCSWSYLIIL